MDGLKHYKEFVLVCEVGFRLSEVIACCLAVRLNHDTSTFTFVIKMGGRHEQ